MSFLESTKMEKLTGNKKKSEVGSCEDCVYYDYDEFLDTYVCTLNLDEDEMVSFLTDKKSECKYFKYYDEYKFVRHQN